MTLAVHNVVQLTDEQVCDRFVVRHHEMEELLAHLGEADPPRHALMIGPRGMGKSLLLRRVAITVKAEADLAARWLPLSMPEELYQVTSIGELWLAALARLAATLGDADLAEQHRALVAERDPARLETLALERLVAAARSRGQRLLLLVENLDMLLGEQLRPGESWSLRRALQTEPDLLLMATAVTTFADLETAKEAFFGFFHRIDLRPLDDDEVRRLWHDLTGVDLPDGRAVAIRILTGGNPRLITVLARFSSKPDLSDLSHNLELLIDEYTPYFKANIEVLPAAEKKVFVTLAHLWAPATAGDVADRTRLSSSEVSSNLGRLMRRGAVQTFEQESGKQRYELTERLYNLYLLLRSPDGADHVRALVDILIHLYEPQDLERTVLPGLVLLRSVDHAPPLDTLIASRLGRHIDHAGVWEQMAPEDLGEALLNLQALLRAQRTELGDEHVDTLNTRGQIAFIVSRSGDRWQALQLYVDVLRDQIRILGSDHPDTLACRMGVAFNTGETGDPDTALKLYRQIVVDSERIIGSDHPDTLTARHNVAYYTDETGDPQTALKLYRQLAADRERIIGPDHPYAVTTRLEVSRLQGALELQIYEDARRPLPKEFRELAEASRSRWPRRRDRI